MADYNVHAGPDRQPHRRDEEHGTSRALNWNYDGIYRLTNETIANDPATTTAASVIRLDPVGNRTSETSSLRGINSGNFGYNADDESAAESYDLNGNTTQSGHGNSYTYDSENHMISTTATARRSR